ncbi:MAG: hybrid sensor histidine kinase/response regulator [Acidobacteriales bacterium]|nr:hybrid sensor histidine kinase/response regulator [Terriglobales bacterium]
MIPAAKISRRPLRALVLEDNPADSELLIYELRKVGYVLTADVLSTRAEYEARLLEKDYEIIFADFNMSMWNGLEALEILQASGKSIPFIIVSGTVGDVDAVEYIRRGATDYVLKGALTRLEVAVPRALEEFARKREQVEAATALRSSEARFRRLIDSNLVGIAVGQFNGTIVEANGTLLSTLGYTRQDLASGLLKWPQLSPPEFQHMHKLAAKQVRATGVSESLQTEYIRKDGTHVPVSISIARIDDSESNCIGFIVDQTSTRKAERHLHVAEEGFAKAFRLSPDALSISEVKSGRIVDVNEAYLRLMGYSRNEIIGHTTEELGMWQKPEQRRELMEKFRVEERVKDVDWNYRTKAGEIRLALLSAELITFGGEAYALKITRDITDQREAGEKLRQSEEALRSSDQRYRILFDENPLPMYVYDYETLMFLDVNGAAIRRYGYSQEELSTMTILDIRPEEEAPKLLEEIAIRSSLPIYKREAGIWKHKAKSGELIDMEILVHRVDLAGRQAIICLAKDVTDQKRIQEQQQETQKLEAIGQLAGGVSHDFNNLLGVIMGQAELLADKLQDESLRSRANSIMQAADRGASLANQLLAFSRKQEVELTLLSLNSLVVETVKLLGRTLGEEVQVVTKLETDLWTVNADAGQLQQVLLNLAINSRDAMPRGGKLIIETANVAKTELRGTNELSPTPQDYVLLSVTDTGDGMTEKVRERIFEPFFTTKAAGKGTGLGLAMVYGIVKQSNGHIWVNSEPGKGTTFGVYFPRHKTELPKLVRQTAPSWGSETLLFVEDQDALREVVAEMLRDHGYTVLEASNGRVALEVASRHKEPIHLVISDVIMPEMSGTELARKIKSVLPSVKLLFISGYTGDSVNRQGDLAEGIAFVQKPFSPTALARKVRQVLDGK